MANRDIVAVGTSAGGVGALSVLARGLEREADVIRNAIKRVEDIAVRASAAA